MARNTKGGRVVLHVGAHKTGTSLVQKFFRDNPSFCAKNGMDYISRSDTNELIGWGKIPGKEGDLLPDRLRVERELHPDDVIVISHENSLGKPFMEDQPGLYPEAERCAKLLRRATRGYDVRVVFYVRPLPDFVESYYLQTIHQGRSHTVQEWIGRGDPGAWAWEPVVEALDNVFGRERVAIGDFSEIKRGQEEFLKLFMSRSGLPNVTGVSYRPVRNASVSARGLAMAMDVNPLLETGEERHITRKFLQKHWSNLQFERARPLSDDLRAQLARYDYSGVAARATADLEIDRVARA
jgi:hypothetical protein